MVKKRPDGLVHHTDHTLDQFSDRCNDPQKLSVGEKYKTDGFLVHHSNEAVDSAVIIALVHRLTNVVIQQAVSHFFLHLTDHSVGKKRAGQGQDKDKTRTGKDKDGTRTKTRTGQACQSLQRLAGTCQSGKKDP